MVESAWINNTGQFLHQLDPEISGEKQHNLRNYNRKTIDKMCSIMFNKTCLSNNLQPNKTIYKNYIFN